MRTRFREDLAEIGAASARLARAEVACALESLDAGHAPVLWTPRAGRVRCRSVAAVRAVAAGARAHPEASPEAP